MAFIWLTVLRVLVGWLVVCFWVSSLVLIGFNCLVFADIPVRFDLLLMLGLWLCSRCFVRRVIRFWLLFVFGGWLVTGGWLRSVTIVVCCLGFICLLTGMIIGIWFWFWVCLGLRIWLVLLVVDGSCCWYTAGCTLCLLMFCILWLVLVGVYGLLELLGRLWFAGFDLMLGCCCFGLLCWLLSW